MAKDLIISSNRHETKVAIMEDEQLVELYFQRANEYSLVGSIHKGRVTRVLPGMQSAFVDIGLERDAFLYVSDFFEESEEYEQVPVAAQSPEKRKAPPPVETGETSFDDRNRDRRGRRSRRRRNQKGRGFPDSKYAPAPSAAKEPVEAQEQVTAIDEDEVLVLPGESLAKYTRGPEPPPPLQEDGEPDAGEPPVMRALEEMAEAIAEMEEESVDSADDFGEAGEGAEAEPEEAAPPASGPEDEQDEDASAETTMPEGELDEGELDDEEEDAGEEEEDTEEDEDERADRAIGGVEAPDIAEGSEEAVPEPPRFKLLSHRRFDRRSKPDERRSAETEDNDIQQMILGQIDETVKAELAAESEEEAAAEDQKRARLVLEKLAPSEGDADRRPGEAEGAGPRKSAGVREQTARFLQRGPRRGRRRGRGGRPETRELEASVQEQAPQPRESSSEGRAEKVPAAERPPLPSIAELLKEGQEILVQIAKEPLGQKGARITSHIALPGRYVVYMPTLDHLGVSRKVGSEEERLRLRRILQTHRQGMSGGFIMRTAGEGKSEKEIAADMNFLYNLWIDIRQHAEKRKAPALLHHDLRVVERVLRDQVTDDFSTIWVDQEEAYESVLAFLERFQPALVKRVRLYTRSEPVFDSFGITQELEKALRPKVWLKSGGYIVINQTEALVAIDINTGKFVGKSNRLEDTIFKTNIEAVKEIARQMRLRDLGGIIVVDFIDMEERKNRQKVMQALEEAMRSDRAPFKILQFNDFGLVAITRKRVKQSLERTLCMPCPYCEGAAYVKSVGTIIGEILSEAHKMAASLEGEDVRLRVHPDVAKVLKDPRNEYLQELEEILGRPLMVTADPLLHHEKFDLA